MFNHKIIIFSLILTLFLPIFVLGLSTGTNVAIQSITYMEKGQPLTLEFQTEGIKNLNIVLAETVKNGQIKAENVDKISWTFQGIACNLIRISSNDATKISEMTLGLKVKESTITKLGLKNDEIKAYLDRTELNTTFQKSENGYAYYTTTAYKTSTKKSGNFDLVIGVGKSITPATAKSTTTTPNVGKAIEEAPTAIAPDATVNIPPQETVSPEITSKSTASTENVNVKKQSIFQWLKALIIITFS